MPQSYAKFLPVLAPLLGSALLVAFAIASLPWSEGLFRRPRTPFDQSAARWVAPAYTLFQEAAAVIPPGASAVARTQPPDPAQETEYYRLAVSLLPGRRILPAAFYGEFVSPDIWRDADFLIIVGGQPPQSPGELLLERPGGSVWRRNK